MTVVFVVDTSASMNQRCANGLSLLDCAKSAVEHFVKMRLRDITWHRGDRYVLVTCEEGLNAIKVVDRFPFTNFMRALKSIEAHDLTDIGASLQQVLDYLHLQRLANDVDKYGQGRYPCSIEPTTILLLTDGTELSSKLGVLKTIVPSGPAPLGGELSAKPYRWDQRVFAIVIRIPSVSQQVLDKSGPLPQNGPISGSQTAVAIDNDISAFCESTGGKCFVATSWKFLMQHIEVTSRLTTCVVVSFENIPVPGTTAPPQNVQAACLRKLLIIRPNQPHQGHWPIPESYWSDPSQQNVPPRDPHPVIAYKAVDCDPSIPGQFVYDKYDIEFNPITNFLLKANAGACWQVFIRNSKGPNYGYGDPFGYLKLLGNTLNLYVLPYNYPELWRLLEQTKVARYANHPQWRQDMERYCQNIPSYYGPPLRAALRQCGLPMNVVPDTLERSLLAGFVGNQLKRLKLQAKTEWESLTEKIVNLNTNTYTIKTHERVFSTGNSGSVEASAPHVANTTVYSVKLATSSSSESALTQKSFEVSIPSSPGQNSKLLIPPTSEAHKDTATSFSKDAVLFKNPFDVPRNELLSQLKYLPMRVALAMDARNKGAKLSSLGSLAAKLVAKEEEEARHSVPIEKMGDFSDALFKQQAPRNPFTDDQERNKQQRSLFGNPYRQEKNDAADEAWMEGSGGVPFRGRKRRRRPDSPSNSGSSSSCGEEYNSDTALEVTSPSKRIDAEIADKKETVGGDTADGVTGKYSMEHENVPKNNNLKEYAAKKKSSFEATEYIISIIRALRYANGTLPNSTYKLFELLSISECPVDKGHLVDQLVFQAYCYKKPEVAQQLKDYHTKLLASNAQA